MSIWDSEIFESDAVAELFEEVEALDEDERADSLIDACRIAVDNEDEDEQLCGLAAAVVAAIWSGAPFGGGSWVEDYSFIRAGIGESPEELAEAAGEVFESLSGICAESTQTMLEDFAEAVE